MRAERMALVCGSEDFVRRLTVALRGAPELPGLSVTGANLAEARESVYTFRPDILIIEFGYSTSPGDGLWIHRLLKELRKRFNRGLYIVPVLTDPAKALFLGNLLFEDEASLEPSGLADNLLMAPPPGIPSLPSIEAQAVHCITMVSELLEQGPEGLSLPALWDDAWAPTMAAPETREVWLRWLPRYAGYINENPLITGPTGSGKTRLARALHLLSGRSGPFISITPRDFSSTELVQAELFGAVAGAYTGAVEKWGLVRKAEKGTLFIDELQSIDMDLQGKLITFIENKTYRRVGEAESHQADVRFIFATNRSLEELVRENKLRDDFAYRLERLQLTLPGLEERRLDIAAGACFALAKVLRERQAGPGGTTAGPQSPVTVEGFTPKAYRKLIAASWPGNLRQLENTIARLVERAQIKRRRYIDADIVSSVLKGMLGYSENDVAKILTLAARQTALSAAQGDVTDLRACLLTLSEQARKLALEHTGGAVEEAAELLVDSLQAMTAYAERR